jgi:hypothetical protein
MGFRPQTDGDREEAWVYSDASRECQRMSYWRWLVFAAMARFEVPEDKYLHIPDGKTIWHDVPADIDPEASVEPSILDQRSGHAVSREQGRAARHSRSALKGLLSWLQGICGRRSQAGRGRLSSRI